jgi:1,4-dihydroxy-2-naphthoyl-CoA hydrolase
MSNEFGEVIPFVRHCGMIVESTAPEEVRGSLPWREDLCTAGGVLHGGAVMAFADTLGAICAFLNLPVGAKTATLESKTNFFRPVTQGVVRGVASPVHIGRTTIVVQTDLRDASGMRVALVTQTQAVLAEAP